MTCDAYFHQFHQYEILIVIKVLNTQVKKQRDGMTLKVIPVHNYYRDDSHFFVKLIFLGLL